MTVNKYYICNNRATPYCVIIDEDKRIVRVYSILGIPVMKLENYLSVFVGSAKKTNFSDVDGPEYNGNSILVQIEPLTYISIGADISQFSVTEPVTEYISVIGNNLVVYAHARTENYIYLISENTVLQASKFDEDSSRTCPYRYFYDICTRPGRNLGRIRAARIDTFDTIPLDTRNITYRTEAMYFYLVNPELITTDFERDITIYFDSLARSIADRTGMSCPGPRPRARPALPRCNSKLRPVPIRRRRRRLGKSKLG